MFDALADGLPGLIELTDSDSLVGASNLAELVGASLFDKAHLVDLADLVDLVVFDDIFDSVNLIGVGTESMSLAVLPIVGFSYICNFCDIHTAPQLLGDNMSRFA